VQGQGRPPLRRVHSAPMNGIALSVMARRVTKNLTKAGNDPPRMQIQDMAENTLQTDGAAALAVWRHLGPIRGKRNRASALRAKPIVDSGAGHPFDQPKRRTSGTLVKKPLGRGF
jgi:hypothetical protein